MALNIMIAGPSGNGKSTSANGLDPTSTMILSANSKPLPWRGSKVQYSVEKKNKAKITSLIQLRASLLHINEKMEHIKTIIVDDTFHLILAKTMADINVPGFNKYKDLANDIYRATADLEHMMRDDLTVVYMMHSEESRDASGLPLTKLKLTGKFTEEVIDLPSYFSYVFEAKLIQEGDEIKYKFLTNKRTDADLAKSPMGCFEELFVDNDIATILSAINDYENDA